MSKEIIKETLEDGPIRYGYYVSHNDFILHRDEKDGPAVIYPSGTQIWFINGERHREDGPALIHSDGTQEWFINDNKHREDGPAVIRSDGTTEWWYNDKIISNEVKEWLNERNIDSDNMTEEDKLALTFFMRSLV